MQLNIRQNKISTDTGTVKKVKQFIWVYFYLLIFEGALRKWVLPGLATPLLLVREPIVLWLIITAWRNKLVPFSPFLFISVSVGTIGIFTAILFGHGNAWVALYGARIWLMHYPLIFVIGSVFTRDDILKMARVVMFISIPMAILIAAQFYSPQTAWINRGVGGDESGGGFSGALGFFRPPATFSFTNGTSSFFGFLAPFVFWFWIYPKTINRVVLIGATIALMISIPLSISRTLLFEVVVTFAFTVLALSSKPQFIGKIVGSVAVVLISLVILNNFDFFQTATEAFTARFEGANEVEGGLNGVVGNRYFGHMIEAFTGAGALPFWGYGFGSGTQVGFKILGVTKALFDIEDEFTRIMGELGFGLGLIAIFTRLGLCVQYFFQGFSRLKTGDLLPWLLLSFALLVVPQGQWAQPTALGFGVLIAGLTMASLNTKKQVEQTS
ncbi:hypothetical protein [Mucilaginibacter jinjuensis]|uniref:O-antigen ligase-like membrane protein n=1 Tax=Mucilaginibacter jinjuensis TaxID=1176721 RepID=A0ABY7TCW0_9SPHI|nr:hypothetical protein [Mucilaginibacter jinjuensis]WCT13836.1 hypothetical protein PQO05_07815 [Mucilaginibacter jinjuensis]